MKKCIFSLLASSICALQLTAQTCTVIDSFNINLPGVDTAQMKECAGMAYSGGYLWISATSDSDRTYFVDNAYIYKYDLSGHRLDSIGYVFGTGDEIGVLTADDTYLWGMKGSTDTLYKIDIATKTFVAAYGMGGRGVADLGHTMASMGDTIYFIGENSGGCFKFSKTATTFVDMPTYTGITGVYPTGLTAVGTKLIATTEFSFSSLSFDDVSEITPGSMTEIVADRGTWCVDIPDALAWGSGYFWQIKTNFLFFDIRNCYVYQVLSSYSALGVNKEAALDASEFKVSPNPAFEHINFSYPDNNNWKMFTATIQNMTGATLFSEDINDAHGEATIDIAEYHLPTGIYLLKLNNGSSQIMKKVVIE